MNFNPGDEVCVITYCAARQGQVGVVRSVLPKIANEPDRYRTYLVEFAIATGATANEHYLGMELEKLNRSPGG